MPYHFPGAKKISLLFLCLVLVTACFTQQARHGIFAGAQSSSAKYSVYGHNQSTSNKYGFVAGYMIKAPFETNLYFSPAAFYSYKGYKVKLTDYAYPPDPMATDNNTSIHTFELAALLQYDFGSQPDHFFIKAGPSLDFQLLGKEKFKLMNGNMVSQDMTYHFGAYGRYSVNFLAQFGFETAGGFAISGQYTLGLVNINNADGGPKIRHRVLGISIGKYFNSKKIVIDTRNKE